VGNVVTSVRVEVLVFMGCAAMPRRISNSWIKRLYCVTNKEAATTKIYLFFALKLIGYLV
jgi:hypothetical protein